MRIRAESALKIVVLAAVAAICRSIATYGLEFEHFSGFALLSALSIFVSFFPVHVAEGRAYHFAGNLSRYAALMLLPLPWVQLISCARIAADVYRKKHENRGPIWPPAIWNAATWVLLDTLIYNLLVRARARPPQSSRDFWVFFAVVMLVEALQATAVFIWISLNERVSILSLRVKPMPEGFVMDVALAFAGVFLARVWARPGAAALLVAVALLVSIRLMRLSAAAFESMFDPKTQLYNPRYFERRLSQELYKASRLGRPLSVLFTDVDNLGTINNSYGHLVGDEVLNTIADVLKRMQRRYVVVSRFGGEEFVVLLIGTAKDGALRIAERLRRQIESANYPLVEGRAVRASMSIGVATYPDDAQSMKDLLRVADTAMYEAKALGKNLVQPAKRTAEGSRAQKDYQILP